MTSRRANGRRKFRAAIAFLTLAFSLRPAGAGVFDIRITDEFQKIVATTNELKKLAGGFQFVEGPIWMPRDGGYLIFSDIPAQQLKKWTPAAGISIFREQTHEANGNCLDLEGRLITCEGGGRRVTLTEKDGTIRTLIDDFGGKKFNSPNDVVVKSDGTIWFSDPDYALKGPKEVDGMYVFRLDPKTKQLTKVITDCDHPNGLCFSPDEKVLYVADSGWPHNLRVYDTRPDGSVANSRVFCVIDKGGPDGIRCDADGRVYSSAGDGVQIFNPAGGLIGKILVPETPANLCFGGADGKTMFITARTSLYSIAVLVRGAK